MDGRPGGDITWRQPGVASTLGFLQHAGLEDLAAASPRDYVATAASLAGDPQRLASLRHSLRPRLAASPMCDGPLFTAALEISVSGNVAALLSQATNRHIRHSPLGG